MGGNRAYRIFEDRPSSEVTKCQEFEEKQEEKRKANAIGKEKKVRKRETPEECTLCGRKGQYQDKVERITYRILSVHTEKENGKCHVADRARDAGGTNARKRGAEKNKRTRVYVRGKPGKGRYTGAGRTPGNKYNKGSDGASDAEWTKSDVSVE